MSDSTEKQPPESEPKSDTGSPKTKVDEKAQEDAAETREKSGGYD